MNPPSTSPSSGPPEITQHPRRQSGIYSSGITFTVTAKGHGSLTYLWLKDDKPITSYEHLIFKEANTPSLQIESFAPDYLGVYSCRVTDEAGRSAKSNGAELSAGG